MAEVVRDASGTVLFTIGLICVFGGIAISFTGIGALCGIPAAIVGFPLMIWGMLMKSKASRNRQEAYLQKGVDEVARMHAASLEMEMCPTCKTPNPRGSSVCGGCGTAVVRI